MIGATFVFPVAAQDPDAAPRPDESVLWMKLTFDLSGGESKSSHGEVTATTRTGKFTVSGRVMAQRMSHGQRKIAFGRMRTQSGSMMGSLQDGIAGAHHGLYGEGGLHEYEREHAEVWATAEMPVTAPPSWFTIVLDLETGKWSCPHLGAAFELWRAQLLEHERYYGFADVDEESEVVRKHSFDKKHPPGGLSGGSMVRIGQILSKQLGLFKICETPQVLISVALSGRLEENASGKCEDTQRMGSITVKGKFEWMLENKLPELELRVTFPEEWRPSAESPTPSGDRVPGKPLRIAAEVVDPAGGSLGGVRIRKLRWSLESTSRIPGIAMNFPYPSDDASPDLEIDNTRATDERQTLEFTDLTTLRSTIQVLPYDWGAWAELRVRAELNDGRVLEGVRLAQSGAKSPVRIPDREPDSHIANAWLRVGQRSGKPDTFDQEEELGDGFTMYEEYRGFYVNREHRTTNPEGLDLFVLDKLDDATSHAALGIFHRATLTTVHAFPPFSLEMDDSRLVNRNSAGCPTAGPQHAIGLRRQGGSWAPDATGKRPVTSWVNVPSAAMFAAYAAKLQGRPDLFERAIAVGMLMGCGCRLPGSGDIRSEQLQFKGSPDGGAIVTNSAGQLVTVRDEASGADLGAHWLHAAALRSRILGYFQDTDGGNLENVQGSKTLYVAVRGGQHSGPLANIMRLCFADAYFVEETSTICVLSPSIPEIVGQSLTAGSTGDGYNAAGARPRTRYGDSKSSPPLNDYCVNDHR